MKPAAGILTLSLFLFSSHGFSQGLPEISNNDSRGSLGIGIGVPYGVLGLNGDLRMLGNLEASVGVGTTMYDHVGIEGGLRYVLTSASDPFKPRLSCFYGTNNIVYFDLNEDLRRDYSGMALGFGFRYLPPGLKLGCDVDVLYLIPTNYSKQIPNVALSFGLRRPF